MCRLGLRSQKPMNTKGKTMNQIQRTKRELKNGLSHWVADYNFACRFGNAKEAFGIKKNIDYAISVNNLDERLVYESNK